MEWRSDDRDQCSGKRREVKCTWKSVYDSTKFVVCEALLKALASSFINAKTHLVDCEGCWSEVWNSLYVALEVWHLGYLVAHVTAMPSKVPEQHSN
jgi:hypothetical protein